MDEFGYNPPNNMTPERWRQVEDVFHAARERDTGERAAFLTAACGADVELRDEVESLLADDGSRADIIERPAQLPATAGSQFGPYCIEASIGKGGMGEVWKAHDSRLNRNVAIKISGQQFSGRFEREARAIAALNHSNICTLYDIGPNYLVMELIEGPTLAERIKKGPIPLPEALAIAKQIADALEAAHEKGIIHRDLKPANIKIRPDGSVKVLDFGLAKADDAAGVASETASMSAPGMIVGTPGYMSPEQARGEKVDGRADIWAFGVVLYEMIVGKRLFEGKTQSDTLAAVLTREPKWELVPARLQLLLRRCLTRDPRNRLRDIGDAMLLVALPDDEHVPLARRLGRRTWIVAGLAAAALAAVAGWALRPTPGTGGYHFTPMEVSWENPAGPVWSPDGTAFVYSAGAAGERQVFLRYLNLPAARPLTGTASAWMPVGWTPDSKRAFVIGPNPQSVAPSKALFSVPVFGGEPELIAPTDAISATVSPDGKTFAVLRKAEDGRRAVFTASPPGSPMRRYAPAPFETTSAFNGPSLLFSPNGRWLTLFSPVTGGVQVWRLPFPPEHDVPRRVLEGQGSLAGQPQMSWFRGDRTGVLSWAADVWERPHLWIAGVRSGASRQITSGTADTGEMSPAISPDGNKLLFVRDRIEYMILSMSLSDASVQHVISSELSTGMPAWALHREKFVYTSNRNGSPAIWMRGEGDDRPIVTGAEFAPGSTASFHTPALSPEADRVIYGREDRQLNGANWISSVSGGPPVRLTNSTLERAFEFGGCWSPDGDRFVYLEVRRGTPLLMVVKTRGEATPTVLDKNAGFVVPQWSPDGKWIAFYALSGGNASSGTWNLISPDGKTVRSFAQITNGSVTFSGDSTRLYGVRSERDHNYLFSMELATGNERVIGDIGKDFMPRSHINPGIRLSLSPDGKSILFPSYKQSGSLWMLDGFDPPDWAMELRQMLPW